MQKIGHFRRRVVPRRASPRSRFILAESDGLVLETIQTYSANPPRRGQPPIETKGIACKQELRLLKLKGTWRANPYNELVFEASGRKGEQVGEDRLRVQEEEEADYATEHDRERNRVVEHERGLLLKAGTFQPQRDRCSTGHEQ